MYWDFLKTIFGNYVLPSTFLVFNLEDNKQKLDNLLQTFIDSKEPHIHIAITISIGHCMVNLLSSSKWGGGTVNKGDICYCGKEWDREQPLNGLKSRYFHKCRPQGRFRNLRTHPRFIAELPIVVVVKDSPPQYITVHLDCHLQCLPLNTLLDRSPQHFHEETFIPDTCGDFTADFYPHINLLEEIYDKVLDMPEKKEYNYRDYKVNAKSELYHFTCGDKYVTKRVSLRYFYEMPYFGPWTIVH